jgi:osmotically-inducible protein OsmY
MKLVILLVAVALIAIGCASSMKYESAPSPTAPAQPAQASQDLSITNQVEENLSDAGMPDLAVKTVNGEVILCGYVGDPLQKQKAEQITESTEGVTKVNNYILVGEQTSR